MLHIWYKLHSEANRWRADDQEKHFSGREGSTVLDGGLSVMDSVSQQALGGLRKGTFSGQRVK